MKDQWINHGEYKSMVCEHHQDIMTCDRCQIFKDGTVIVDKSTFWQKLRNPIGWLKMKRYMRKLSEQLKREQGL